MINKLIEKHIEKLTITDIYNFALKNQVCLNEIEAQIIYSYIKSYWRELIFQDHNIILDKVKDSLEPTTYNKIIELIILYKNKYKNYL